MIEDKLYPSKATIEVNSRFLVSVDILEEMLSDVENIEDVLSPVEFTSNNFSDIELEHMPPSQMFKEIEISARNERNEIILENIKNLLGSLKLIPYKEK